MSHQKELGVVVVGLGMAGKVRVRDLKENTCGVKLRGVVSRRPVEIEDVKALTFEDALEQPDVHALILCTEPAFHEEQVRQGLENGKHILVEFPLALSSKAAKSLYELADHKGLVLHEENIALLTECYNVLKSKASHAELKSGEYGLKGSYNGWIETFDKSGLPFITGISAIQTPLSLFGDLKVVGGSFHKNDDGYTAHADVKTQYKKPISMTLIRCRTKDARREKKTVYKFEDGEIIDGDKIPNTPQTKPGLFMMDLENFIAEVKQGKTSEENKRICIRSLEIAEDIHSFF